MSTPILFAAGPNGTTLNVPDGVRLLPITSEIVPGPARSESEQRALVKAALEAPESGPALSKLASIKRRAAILVGDLSRPAPYDIALPVVIETLVAAGIRPSRIALFACPGGCGTLLGRAAIHRYGEEVCGDHEILAWPENFEPPPQFVNADLCIAIASASTLEPFKSFLPKHTPADFGIEISLGVNVAIDIQSVRAFSLQPGQIPQVLAQIEPVRADVWITSGGGAPWEETLEEAMQAIADTKYVIAKTAVLIFSGAEGLGSSRFARDIWSLIEQAEEVLAAGKSLGEPSNSPHFDPANVLADSLKQHASTILFSPALAEHFEGEDLIERLDATPHVAARLALCGTQENLWNALALLHGPNYTVAAEPLGWRGR